MCYNPFNCLIFIERKNCIRGTSEFEGSTIRAEKEKNILNFNIGARVINEILYPLFSEKNLFSPLLKTFTFEE